MALSTVPFAQAEQTLTAAALHGILPVDETWTPSRLSSLYNAVRTTTHETFPPAGYTTTSTYLPISYVQSPKNPPPGWAPTVHAALHRLHEQTGTVHGIWFDKMGSRQFPALQSLWGPLANLHYAVRPVIHVTPPLCNHMEQLRDKPVCGLSFGAYHLVCDWLAHHDACDECRAAFGANLGAIGFAEVAEDIDGQQWAHPGAYFRCWPMVERSLALYNQGLLTTEGGILAILCTTLALSGLLKTTHDIRSSDENTDLAHGDGLPGGTQIKGFRILNHHIIYAEYKCGEARKLASSLPPSYEETVQMMADRMAVDCTKMEPLDVADKYDIARKLHGWTSGTSRKWNPIFARDLLQHNTQIKSSTIDFDLAKTDIVSGWAGRAPCFAEGDKIAAAVLFSNFALGSRLAREKGAGWLHCFVDELYRQGVGLFNDDPALSFHLDAFENYAIIPASLGQELSCDRETNSSSERDLDLFQIPSKVEDRHQAIRSHNSFGRYSGCIPVVAFYDFLRQCSKDLFERQQLLYQELQLWQYHVEIDGQVFQSKDQGVHMDSQSLQPRISTCPSCSREEFILIGSIWRSTRGKMGKRRCWVVSDSYVTQALCSDENSSNPVSGLLLAAGEVRMDTQFASRCRECNCIAERKVFRGWPLLNGEAWEAILVPDISRRAPQGRSLLSGLRPLQDSVGGLTISAG